VSGRRPRLALIVVYSASTSRNVNRAADRSSRILGRLSGPRHGRSPLPHGGKSGCGGGRAVIGVLANTKRSHGSLNLGTPAEGAIRTRYGIDGSPYPHATQVP
jgi:hypothetical protein